LSAVAEKPMKNPIKRDMSCFKRNFSEEMTGKRAAQEKTKHI
jgi:hypothetical protein